MYSPLYRMEAQTRRRKRARKSSTAERETSSAEDAAGTKIAESLIASTVAEAAATAAAASASSIAEASSEATAAAISAATSASATTALTATEAIWAAAVASVGAASDSTKTPMEESADALAGIDGSMSSTTNAGTNKRKTPDLPSSGGAIPNLKGPAKNPKNSTTKGTAKPKANSKGNGRGGKNINLPKVPSMEKLTEAAQSILTDIDAIVPNLPAITHVAAIESNAAAGAARKVNNNTAIKLPPKAAKSRASSPQKNIRIATKSLMPSTAASVSFHPSVPNPMAPELNSPLAAAAATVDASKPSNSKEAEAKAYAFEKAKSEREESNQHAANKKSQIQYNPDIPMTKEQLTAWRREMRRVRNRESAAASRRKVRDRIEELEAEVEHWKARYAEVAELVRAQEEKKRGSSNGGGGAAPGPTN